MQKWIKVSGGNGTCSTGCSCSYPESNGTTDGETATPACKRLTCQKCCGNADCCPITVECCPNLIIPKTLYLTFSDPNGVWPCADGVSIAWPYKFKSTSGGYTNYVFYREFVTDEALLCAGQGSYSFGTLGTVCASTKLTNCGSDVKIAGYIYINQPNTEPTPCLIGLSLYLQIGFRKYQTINCVLSACSTNSQISFFDLPQNQVFTCGPIDYQFEDNVKACEILSDDGWGCTRTAVHYGATDGTVLVTITE